MPLLLLSPAGKHKAISQKHRHAVKCVVRGLVCLCDGICQIEFSTQGDEGEISAAVYGSLAADFTLNILDTISSAVSQQDRCYSKIEKWTELYAVYFMMLLKDLQRKYSAFYVLMMTVTVLRYRNV